MVRADGIALFAISYAFSVSSYPILFHPNRPCLSSGYCLAVRLSFHLISVPSTNSWWYDTVPVAHVSLLKQLFRSQQILIVIIVFPLYY